MKKIAIVSNLPIWEASVPYNRPDSAGHYSVWLSAVCKALEHQKDYEVHWLILDKTIKRKRVVETRGQVFHLLPKARLTIGLCTGYAYDSWIILQTLKKIQPDLVHSWGTENSYSIAASRYQGKKLLSIQGLLKACAERANVARFERLQALYEPYTIRQFKHITTESPWAANEVQKIDPSARPILMEYAVENDFFYVERTLSDMPCCLYGGNNTPVKNVATLIEAFSSPQLAHVKLILAGISPDSYPNLPDNVCCLGHINRRHMIQQMSQAWCLVHPSLADTGPTIAKEARVMGLPIMLTTECGSTQHITPGKSGYIVHPHDVDAMRKSILQMTSSKETAMVMGKHGQETCRNKLSSNTMIHTLLRIYEEIMS